MAKIGIVILNIIVRIRRWLNPKKTGFVHFLMTDLAGNWLASLPDTSTDSYGNIKQAYDARYKVPEMVKYKSAKDLFSRKQQQSESVDDICAGLQKGARISGRKNHSVCGVKRDITEFGGVHSPAQA